MHNRSGNLRSAIPVIIPMISSCNRLIEKIDLIFDLALDLRIVVFSTAIALVGFSGTAIAESPQDVRQLLDSRICQNCDLRGADLRGAYLKNARMRGSDLTDADLSDANLTGAYFTGATLSGADLSGAELEWANLRDADLRDADLRDANLSRSDLDGANLDGADLEGTNLCRAKMPDNTIHSC